MLKNSDPVPIPAAETRVSTHELTEALASIDARKTREAFARVGTVTLAEGLRDSEVEASPAELYAEIEMLREADAAQAEVKRRQRRLALILKAEIVSVALCFLTLLGFQQTLYNPAWQQARQVQQAAKEATDHTQEFRQLLALSSGPNPQYQIFAVSPFGNDARYTQTKFPVSWLPDGLDIHSADGFWISDTIQMPVFSLKTGAVLTGPQIVFQRTEPPSFKDTITIYYDGISYWRAWIRKSDVPNILNAHACRLYPSQAAARMDGAGEIVLVTVPTQSVVNAHGQEEWTAGATSLCVFPEGQQVSLDEHAWEQSPNALGGRASHA